MDYNKTPVIYEEQDPTQEGVTFVAIQTETEPPYVWAAYFIRREDIPRLGEDMLVIPVKLADRLFDFQKGSINELVSLPNSKL